LRLESLGFDWLFALKTQFALKIQGDSQLPIPRGPNRSS
jgi:hypothetical protein